MTPIEGMESSYGGGYGNAASLHSRYGTGRGTEKRS